MYEDYLLLLIQKHRSRGLVVDTNLLLVYLVGLCDRRLIQTFKRTQSFTPDDFDLLANFLQEFARIITTPAILTEVNSLANQLTQRQKPSFYSVFREQIGLLDERHRPSSEACQHTFFPKCGLSDAAILTIAESGLLVLTDDFELTGYLQNREVDCINFNHLRQF